MPVTQNNHPKLTSRQGQALVELARQTLAVQLKGRFSENERDDLETHLQDPVYQVRCGAFVTLKIGESLRGCIGSLEGRESLVDCVRKNAINAAFHDPRFRPLSKGELDRLTIEVSVLTPSRPLVYDGAEDLLDKLQPGIDGVTIRKNYAGATFLPQVWGQLPEKKSFMKQLCLKAGLSADAWRGADLQVETYQVQYFEASL